MKRLLITSAFVLAVAGSVSATTYNPSELTPIVAIIVHRYLPNADLSHLTVGQVNEVNLILMTDIKDDRGSIASLLSKVLNAKL